ncbi:MAG: protein kinase, partial [Planctomycetes bacterium]|nr:protein kinase [Planctomycetota bacterium]
KSPHVVTIYAVEEQDGEPYIVMECIRGQSLGERLEHGPPMSIKEIVEVGIQIAKGLAAAHEKGIIHRDVKPSNILLEEETSQVKITDFGLSRAIAGD